MKIRVHGASVPAHQAMPLQWGASARAICFTLAINTIAMVAALLTTCGTASAKWSSSD
ncbi:MAG TPA: hypothetical protein PK400_04325 [Phycisphaerales bacterium]|nr:hypothetical protein [Phycisphaerales bacterium]HRQ74698.1 hypothetical protein [Phycisphaerales bacterium]